MLAGDFMFTSRFTDLPEGAIEEAIAYIEVAWCGIRTLWSKISPVLREQKRDLCINYLVAWYLADLYPACIQGVYTQNGANIRSKNIGGTEISFNARKVQASLEVLTTNIFGIRALDMITTCPDMFLLR
jgi:hypothetical protein